MYERETERGQSKQSEPQPRVRQPQLDLYDLHPNVLSTFPTVTGSVVSPVRLISWLSLTTAAILLALVYLALRGI